ncbi:ABC-2 type transport system permease protein [Paenibacillus sp. UNCCL117]|uniref:ABC-2 family transporter protein n=1 Tax=unclassified Paenibacillus TaxID=185978 RepID=UPI00088216A0|nr:MULTISPECIES: ABC-2 family transporter protein [unclassified Paenibacillus]SDD77048.1 ABC-2 type transport system permease protein [Paenibacillus sp. cl123]SFW52614.1 ABC-2 type transport system permease protein [Paenibacillus sp. UNCCL117]
MSLLFVYVQRYFLQWFAWRSFAFTLAVNQVVPPLIGLAVWETALPGNETISAYYFVLIIVRLMTVSYENHTFSTRIYNGDLMDDLLRPHPVMLQSLGENIAIRIWHTIIGLPLFVILGIVLDMELNIGMLLLALPAVVLAAALQYVFTYLLAMSAFWTERAHSIVSAGGLFIYLLGGIAAPIGLMPELIKQIAALLPFQGMMAFPAELSAGMLDSRSIANGYIQQGIWLCIMLTAARLVWRFGIRKYTAAGA